MMRANFPDFVVIGAAKAGTTSLRRYLAQHPDIFMVDYGEPSFFAHENEGIKFVGPGDEQWTFVTTRREYEDLFRPAPPNSIRGEISPRYLYFPRASDRMRHYVPNAKVVAILRHPVDRAYSHYMMNRSRGCEPEGDFEAALALEAERTARGWGWDWRYVSVSRYHEQVARYVMAFPRQQLKFYLYEDWQRSDGALYADLFGFLGVDVAFQPDISVRERVTTMPRSHTIARIMQHGGAVTTLTRHVVPTAMSRRLKSRIAARNAVTPPRLADADRKRLFGRWFADDCAALENLIDRDLSVWA